MKLKERKLKRIIVALCAVVLILGFICLYQARYAQKPKPVSAQPYIDALHARDTVIATYQKREQQYQDSLKASVQIQTQLKTLFDEKNVIIRGADTNRELDSLWAAAGIK
jgi:hypothetical protein